jgi:hypothetical protein
MSPNFKVNKAEELTYPSITIATLCVAGSKPYPQML